LPQAAERLGVSRQTVRRLISTGDLPSVRIGSRVLIRPGDIAAFIDARVDGPTAKAAA